MSASTAEILNSKRNGFVVSGGEYPRNIDCHILRLVGITIMESE
jgi:hypothetical protein